MPGDVVDIDRRATMRPRRQYRIDDHTGRQVQSALLEVTQARREAVTKERHQPEDMIGRTTCIDRVLLDRQARLVIEQAVEDVRRFAGRCGDDLRMERAVLVGNVGVEADTRFIAVAGINVGDGFAAAAGEEVLTV